MLPRTHHPSSSSSARRRSPNLPQICAVLTALLLLLSLAVLHSRLSLPSLLTSSNLQSYPSLLSDPFDDADNDAFDGLPDDDRIDVLDLDDSTPKPPDNDDEPESDDDPQNSKPEPDSDASALVWDHVLGVHRRSFGKPDAESDPDPNPDPAKIEIAFSSDDQPLGDRIRSKLHSVRRIEDVLMIKTGSENPLRDGWALWLEGKGDFLRRDRMLKSNLELLNPKNHPLLQDPDVVGVSGYTRGDRLVQKSILKEMEKVPFPVPRREVRVRRRLEEEEESGRRWGYFPGINEKGGMSFSDFVDKFFETGKCSIRIFMVWNSPSWMFGVRHQRGLESVLKMHRDACVLVLSEMMEMDSFERFVKDGYEILLDNLCLFTYLWYQLFNW